MHYFKLPSTSYPQIIGNWQRDVDRARSPLNCTSLRSYNRYQSSYGSSERLPGQLLTPLHSTQLTSSYSCPPPAAAASLVQHLLTLEAFCWFNLLLRLLLLLTIIRYITFTWPWWLLLVVGWFSKARAMKSKFTFPRSTKAHNRRASVFFLL